MDWEDFKFNGIYQRYILYKKYLFTFSRDIDISRIEDSSVSRSDKFQLTTYRPFRRAILIRDLVLINLCATKEDGGFPRRNI